MAGLNNSIFDLPSSVENLRRPEDVIKITTKKVNPTSSSKLGAFPGSDIEFNFTISGNQHWLPSRSFVVIRNSIYVGVGDDPRQPSNSTGVAPSMNMPANLFDGCSLSVGGYNLGNISKFVPQISACQRRLQKSAGFLDGVAKSAMFFDADFNSRMNQITTDGAESSQNFGESPDLSGTITITTATSALVGVGTAFTTELQPGDTLISAGGQAVVIQSIADATNAVLSSDAHTAEAGVTYKKLGNSKPTGRSNQNESIFVPPLGVFSQGKSLPNGSYILNLSVKPDLVYKQSAISSNAAVTIEAGNHTADGDLPTGNVEFAVNDIQFYVCVVSDYKPSPVTQTIVLDLEEIDVIPRQIAGSASITETFTVKKSTFGLSVALQDSRAGTNTLYSPSVFKVEDDLQQQLSQLQIDYAGQSRPSHIAKPEFKTDTKGHIDYETHRYLSNGVESLAYYDTGGMLPKEDWRDLGELYHFQWRKTGDNNSTSVDVQVGYPAFTGGRKNNLLLFTHYRRILEYTISSGQVVSFLGQDA